MNHFNFTISEYQVAIIVDVEDHRFSPLTDGNRKEDENIPRCLLPVNNKELLSYQIDMLINENVKHVFIVIPIQYTHVFKQYYSCNISKYLDIIHLEMIFVEMEGAVDGLRALTDRIYSNEIICISSDIISQFSLRKLIEVHKLKSSDVTILLSTLVKENDSDGKKSKHQIDDEDKEFMVFDEDDRILMKTSILDIEDSFSIQKALFNKTKSRIRLRTDLIDMGIYILSKWILNYILDNNDFVSLKFDLIPYLIQRQFQSKEYLYSKFPTLIQRKRILDSIDPWLVQIRNTNGGNTNGNTAGNSIDLVSILAEKYLQENNNNEPLSPISSKENIQKDVNNEDKDEDLLRCYSVIYDLSQYNELVVLRRIMNIPAYIALNRDLPLLNYNSSVNLIPWSRVENYHKKEQSVIGINCVMGEKVTIKQCVIGSDTTIDTKAKLNNSIIMNGVKIGEKNAIVESNCNLNDCIIGDNIKIPMGSKHKSETFSMMNEFEDHLDEEDDDAEEEVDE